MGVTVQKHLEGHNIPTPDLIIGKLIVNLKWKFLLKQTYWMPLQILSTSDFGNGFTAILEGKNAHWLVHYGHIAMIFFLTRLTPLGLTLGVACGVSQ